jgi:hypothetical protein
MLKIIFILATIILILFLVKVFNFKKAEQFFSGGFQHILDGEVQTIDNQDIREIDFSTKYSCTDEGCVRDDANGNLLFYECNEKCRFNYNKTLESCEKKEDGQGEYKNKSTCNMRYVCSNEKGRCIIAPSNRADSFDTIDECKTSCWFRKKNGDECIKFDPLKLYVPSKQKYQYKADCENRYKCIEGRCVKTPDGIFNQRRECLQNCQENIYNNLNKNKIILFFDKRVDNLYEYNNEIFLKKIIDFIISFKIVNRHEILGILQEDNKAIIVFTFYLNDNMIKLDQIFNKINLRLYTIISNFVDYNIIKIINLSCSTDSQCNRISVINRNEINLLQIEDETKYIILEIQGLYDSIKQKSFQFKNISTLESTSSKNEKLIYLDKFESAVFLGINNFSIDELTKLFYTKNKNDTYENKNNFNFKMQNLSDELVDILESKQYYDMNLVKSIYANQFDVKLLTISKPENNQIFNSLNEILFLLYRNNDYKFKYLQITIDLKKKQKLFFLEQKYRINNDKLNEELTQNDFKIINNVKLDEENNFENILNNLITSEQLKLKFKLTYFDNNSLKQEMEYIEESDIIDSNFSCIFSPRGETIMHCYNICNSEEKNCSEGRCKEICNNCKNLDCKWNLSDFNEENKLKPSSAKIKCFSGNKAIKVTWIQPFSRYLPDKYYIIVINTNLNTLDIHQYYSENVMNEYIINGLFNDNLYNIKVITKNKYGVSEESNLETITPNKNKTLQNINKIKFSEYEDSIESFYKNTTDYDPVIQNVNINNRISILERELVLNDLKEIINDKKNGINTNLNSYEINIH